jgi:hypothetical protein
VLLHCESGERAASIAAGFVAIAEAISPDAAAASVCSAAHGRLTCRKQSCANVAQLSLELAQGGGGRARKGVNVEGGRTHEAAQVSAHARAAQARDEAEQERAEQVGQQALEAEEEFKREQQMRREKYLEALKKHGPPGTTKPAAAAGHSTAPLASPSTNLPAEIQRASKTVVVGKEGVKPKGAWALEGGWSTVVAKGPVKGAFGGRPPASSPASSFDDPAQTRTHSEDLSKKQRQNRRKAEKAREDREALRLAGQVPREKGGALGGEGPALALAVAVARGDRQAISAAKFG